MKNKILLCACSLAVLVGLLTSCKNDADVVGISQGIAKKTLLGIYTYTQIDSASMQVFKKECALKKDDAGNQVGYYRESKAGQGAPKDESTSFTWDAAIAADNLSMLVTAQLEDGTTMTFTWVDGIIVADSKSYDKSVSGLSDVDIQNTINANIENTTFQGSSAAYHEHLDTIPYLAWKTKVDRKSYAPEDTAAAAQKYRDQLAPHMDTIVWYLRTQVAEHTLGYVYLDTVFAGEDTTYVPRNVVYVDPVANTSGKHLITYLTSEVKKLVAQVNDRPSSQIVSTMTFKRVNNVNTAVYSIERHEWSNEYYINPASEKAYAYDSIYTFTASAWVTASFVNAKKFDILLSGKEELTLKQVEGGVEVKNKETAKEGAFTTLSISEFDKNKGVATQAEIKYSLLNN